MPAALPTNSSEALARSELSEPAPSAEFLNRDLSWLEFNARVLHEAVDQRTPLLERAWFLGIFTSNLDEFFMKRVGALRRQAAAGKVAASGDGTTIAAQLSAIRERVLELQRQQSECYRRSIHPALSEAGVRLLSWEDLDEEEVKECERFFRSNVFPILTPLAVDPGHPFPFISNLSESAGVVLQHPDHDEPLFARVKVPQTLKRWILLSASAGHQGEHRFVSLYDIIHHNLDDLFPGMRIVDVMFFRVTRSADLEVAEDDADDLRDVVAEELRLRRFAPVVRLELPAHANPWLRHLLIQELEIDENSVYELDGEIDYQELRPICDLHLADLRYDPWTPVVPPALADEGADLFGLMRGGDMLLHHPYESFTASVERFISAAADDPRVLAIKMTLYRTSDESPFIRTLIRAAETNKQVVCLVELKARFDEERNILMAHALEKAGVHVVYGLVGLKTHTKVALVVRQDPDGIRCYAHIGTGNYHPQTARAYTDLGLLTCDPDITADVVELFHYLTGRSLQQDYRKLLVAPVNMRPRFLQMIQREAAHAKAGRPAQIIAKMNSLEERKTVRALYEASEAGVGIDLIVRGFCCLRPGVEGMSQNVRVVSIIGRFLEHSRIFYFRNGAADPLDGEFYIGSADWMYRNLLARVEAITPIESRPLRARLWEILQTMLHDRRQAWDMQPDGSYVQRQPAGPNDVGTHRALMEMAGQPGGQRSRDEG